MKPAVRRASWPAYGLFGAEYRWEIYVGLVCVGSMRVWGDAVAVANLFHRALSASSVPDRSSADWDGIDAILASDRAAIDGSEPSRAGGDS